MIDYYSSQRPIFVFLDQITLLKQKFIICGIKNDLTFRFSGFWQKSNQSICTLLYWIWKNLQSSNLLWKPNIWELWPENFRPIRMQDSLNVDIPQTSRGMNYNFCAWSSIYRSNEYIQSFKVGVVRHAKACAKQCNMVGQLNLKN